MLRTALLVLAACGSQPSPRAPDRAPAACPLPIGNRTLYTISASDTIGALERCGANQPDEGFIRVTGRGTRTFSIAPLGKATGCTAPDGECDTVDLGAFVQAVGVKLRERGIAPVSTMGLGRCGYGSDGARWERHMSIKIYHWKHANDAVTVLDEELRRWNVGDSYEIAVEHVPCGTAEGQVQTALGPTERGMSR